MKLWEKDGFVSGLISFVNGFKVILGYVWGRGAEQRLSCAARICGTPRPVIRRDKCVSCKLCLEVCPAQALFFAQKALELDPKRCVSCGLCVESCPEKALEQDFLSTEEKHAGR